MKYLTTTLLTATIAGFSGGIISHYFFSDTSVTYQISKPDSTANNPFQTESEPDDSNFQIKQLQQQINSLDTRITELIKNQKKTNTHLAEEKTEKKNRFRRPVPPTKESLTLSGISPDIADALMRRIGQQEYRRLELQNLMQRSDSTERREYSRELRALNKNKISLRDELGEENFDQYLYASGQNNRVMVSSVMAGSPAESSGFQDDDIILTYGEQKILSWNDLRQATVQGEIGNYVNVDIIRDGAPMSLMVPRGTLGVQLDATQLDPAE